MIQKFDGIFEIVTESATLPITIDELKNFTSIRWQGTTEDDENFTTTLASAFRCFEKFTGRIIIQRTIDCRLCGFHNFFYRCIDPKLYPFNQTIDIEKPDIQAINSVEYSVNDVYNTLDPTKYKIRADSTGATIWSRSNANFPTNYDVMEDGSSMCGAVKINFGAGYTDLTIPVDIKLAILEIASHFYNIDPSCAGQFDNNSPLPPMLMNRLKSFTFYCL